MTAESNYLLIQNIPKGKSLFHKKADIKDLQNHAMYLEILFSSAPLCLQEYIFELLAIDDKLKKLIQYRAKTKLKTLGEIANSEVLINPYKLIKKNGDFHTIYITSRPLQVGNNTSNSKPIQFDHWALKFEGDQNLLTVEFLDEQSKDHGIVKMQMLPNTCLNRRVWWYWWETDDEKYDINHMHKKPSLFTKRWESIWKVYVKSITAECIGKLIIRWLRTNDYAIYQVAKNNCQHFVRDIIAVLDIS
eukprot:219922_1